MHASVAKGSVISAQRQQKFYRFEKKTWLVLGCLLIWFCAGSGVFGMKLWFDRSRGVLHHLAWQKEQLVQQFQWISERETVILPYLEHLQLTRDDLLDVSDRVAYWLRRMATPAADFNWSESVQLTINGMQHQAQNHARVGLMRHQLLVNTSIEDENMLLSLMNTVGRISPGTTDIRSCRLLRATQTTGLDWHCRVAIVALPDHASSSTTQRPHNPDNVQAVSADPVETIAKVPTR